MCERYTWTLVYDQNQYYDIQKYQILENLGKIKKNGWEKQCNHYLLYDMKKMIGITITLHIERKNLVKKGDLLIHNNSFGKTKKFRKNEKIHLCAKH